MRVLAISFTLACAVVPAHTPAATPQIATEIPQSVQVNFDNVDVRVVTESVAYIVRKAILVTPEVKVPITWQMQRPLPVDEFYKEFLRALARHGLAATESADAIRIGVVPAAPTK